MSDASTTSLLAMYMEEATAPMFLSGFFQSPPQNFHNTEKVEIDVIRDDEDVAVVLTDLSVGARSNEATKYTSKGFTPPIFKEKGPVTAYKLMQRQAGQNPFQDPDFGANATTQAFNIFRRLERKIRRSMEQMASQVLQTGAVTLRDENAAALFNLDFQPKSSHFPTVGVQWSEAGTSTGENKLKDLEDLSVAVRRDGKQAPDQLIFGSGAMRKFLNDPKVQARLDNRSMTLGSVAPQTRGEGATFMGWVWIGMYRFEMWAYDGFFKAPGDPGFTPYVADDKVIMRASKGRLDMSFGGIPQFENPATNGAALSFLPRVIASADRSLSLTTSSWVEPDGSALWVQAGARPLTIPTAIDTFGCLDTVIAT